MICDMKNTKEAIWRILLVKFPVLGFPVWILYVFTLIIAWILPASLEYDMQIEYSEGAGTAQLFYDIGAGYSEGCSVLGEIVEGRVVLHVTGDVAEKALRYRFDPVDNGNGTVITQIKIYRGDRIVKNYPVEKLQGYVAGYYDVSKEEFVDGKWKLSLSGQDVQIHFSESWVLEQVSAVRNFVRISRGLLVSVCFLLLQVLFAYFTELLLLAKHGCAKLILAVKCGCSKLVLAVKYGCAKLVLVVKHSYAKLLLIVKNNCQEKLSKTGKVFYFLAFLLFTADMILFTVVDFLVQNYDGLSIEEMIFHLKVPLQGTSNSLFSDYFQKYYPYWIIYILFIATFLGIFFKWKEIRNQRWVYRFCLSVSVFGAAVEIVLFTQHFEVIGYVKNQLTASVFIEENYVDPDSVTLIYPEKKRNLIYIYMESMESTFASKENGGAMSEELMPELVALAEQNISFSGTGLLGGACASVGSGWTMGGMFAQTAGLPLLLPIDGNSYGDYATFAPGAVSIGELLSKMGGYQQELMVGSDIVFGGRKYYFEQHGAYELWDYYTAVEKGEISEEYRQWWGYEDVKLYEYAKKEIVRLSEEEVPFNFTMLTADTHHIGGYPCEKCGSEFDVQYKNVIACASRQVFEFVEWLKEQEFYENTTIIISGDHPTMDSGFMEGYYDGSVPRRVYNCIINAACDKEAVRQKNRLFHTFDMYPTTLAALGVKIEGERLGLGTNLFSDVQTLAEEYGFDYIDEEFNKSSRFYRDKILEE